MYTHSLITWSYVISYFYIFPELSEHWLVYSWLSMKMSLTVAAKGSCNTSQPLKKILLLSPEPVLERHYTKAWSTLKSSLQTLWGCTFSSRPQTSKLLFFCRHGLVMSSSSLAFGVLQIALELEVARFKHSCCWNRFENRHLWKYFKFLLLWDTLICISIILHKIV